MTAKGTLNLDCIASDPASRFLYGIASANNASTTGDYSNSRFVLVRSNPSPTSLATLTWTVISQIDGKDYSYNYPTFTSVDCAANYDDAFAVFFRNPIRTTNPTDAFPMGLVKSAFYDWTQIKGYAPYGWTSDRFIHMSYYTAKDDSPVHVVTNQEGSVIVSGSIGGGSYLHDFRIKNIHEWVRFPCFRLFSLGSCAFSLTNYTPLFFGPYFILFYFYRNRLTTHIWP
jgi:hypothetical protein